MNYKPTHFNLYGLSLDTFKTPDGRVWVTLTSLAKGLGVHRQTLKNWLDRPSAPSVETLEVRVGPKGNARATAYPVDLAVEFLYFLMGKGNKQVITLLSLPLKATLKNSLTNKL